MNNKTIVWVIIALAVLGGAWYLLNSPGWNMSGAPAATTTPPAATPAKRPSAAKAPAAAAPTRTTAKIIGGGSLKEVIGLGQSLVCSVKTTSSYARSGTLYVSGGMAYADFATSIMIDDGNFLYVWTKGATTGLKLSAAVGASGSAIATNGGVDPSADNLSYACNPWTADASIFTPPATVSF